MRSHDEPVGVLLIDDDALSREILELLLMEAGYAVTAVGSGEEAVALLRSGFAVEVVLADLQMPGLAGKDLALRLREGDVEPPRALLAMSGSEPKAGTVTDYDGFLLKPFTMEQLAAAMEVGPNRPVARELTDVSAVAVEADAGEAPVLDEGKLEQLRASFRPAQLDELFCFAVADAERQVAEMQRAQEVGDDGLYRRCAHSMKGSFGMLGAPEMRDLAAKAEGDGLDNMVNGVTTLVLFEGALRRLRHTLRTRGISQC